MIRIDPLPPAFEYRQLASILPYHSWRRIVQFQYQRNKRRTVCEFCGAGTGLHLDERWLYDAQRNRMVLQAMEWLCEPCLRWKHLKIGEHTASLIRHYCKLNKVTEEGAYEDIQYYSAVLATRSKQPWVLDYGVNQWMLELTPKQRGRQKQ